MSNEYQMNNRKGPYSQDVPQYELDNHGTIYDMENKGIYSSNIQPIVSQQIDGIGGHLNNTHYGNNYQQQQQQQQQQQYVMPNSGQVPLSGYHETNGNMPNMLNQSASSVGSSSYNQNQNMNLLPNNQYNNQQPMIMMPNSQQMLPDQNKHQSFQNNTRDSKVAPNIHVPNYSVHNNGVSNLQQQVPSSNQAYNQSNRVPQSSKFVSKGWHSSNDSQHREAMNKSIIHLLQQKKPNANTDWQDKLPHMAKRLEENLYFSANGLEEYMDTSTLKARLQQLAVQMGGKQAQAAVNRQQMIGGSINERDSQTMKSAGGSGNNNNIGMNQNNFIPPGSGGYMPRAHDDGGSQKSALQPHSMSSLHSQQQQQQQYINNTGTTHINNYNHNNTDTGHVQSSFQNMQHQGIVKDHNRDLLSMEHVSNSNEQQTFVNMSQINQQQPLVNHMSINQQSSSLQGHQTNIQNNVAAAASNTDEHRKQVLKQQQQRLLLLRHASKCSNDTDCTVTPHCQNMKLLWKHIMSCKDQECKTPHCVSSRYVLSHYSKCKDQHCPVCAPVRDAIRNSLSKNSFMPMMKPEDSQINYQNNIEQQPTKKAKLSVKEIPQVSISMNLNTTTVNQADSSSKKSLTKLDPVSCGLYCFTNEQIQAHISSIHEGMRITASKVKEICMPLIDDLLKQPQASNIFGVPVDPVFLNLPDYFDIIKSPMDLGTIKRRLESLHYRDTSYFVRDVHLTFDNAMLYNPKSSDIHHMAKQMKKEFDTKFKNAITHHQSVLDANRLNPDACSICGEIKLAFEPPVFYCNGHCGGQRIRRNAFFYSAGNNNYHWCSICFNDLKENQPIPVGDTTITKSELGKSKKKHQEDAEESWVECDGCSRWVHQICALFNSRRNFTDSQFSCPTCLTVRRKTSPEIVSSLTSKTKASDLPQCNMTEFIEKRITQRLEEAYKDDAAKRGVSINDIEKCPQLVLRQVSSIDKMQPTREGMLQRYAHKNYPQEFPCRTKCLVLFQNIDGQDVILFGMYVYEYGHKCPAPNQRRVYVSYLDSVHYFRPKQYRTVVYHEILISYLEYVKLRGFHTAHIWSCPPAKGDDYILYCHPSDQKTPKSDKLQKWYADMIDSAKERGIVEDVNDLYSEFLTDTTLDASVLPYFEGDYWTTEAEVIVKNLNSDNKDGGETNEDNSNDDFSKKSKRKSKSTTKLTPSGRPTCTIVKPTSALVGGRDPVMAKMASIIEPMKNTFFVVRLRSKEYAEQCALAREKELLSEGDRDDNNNSIDQQGLNEETNQIPSKNVDLSQSDSQNTSISLKQPMQTFEMSVTESKSETQETNNIVKVETNVDIESDSKTKEIVSSGNVNKTQESIDSITDQLINQLQIKDDTEDADDVQESEHWDTRQSFLNLCQGNHYQYDQLRRAKHSSLLVLYLMHNPDAPKFLTSCANCHKEILAGIRRRCDQCDIDYCDACVSAFSAQRLHPQHYLRPMPVTGSAPVQQITAQERLDRQNALRLHLQLLFHAAYCEDASTCKAKNCSKMKDFFGHLATCPNASRGCPTCKRVKGIIAIHARQCRQENCRVPKCIEMKEEFRRSALRQQQMDDRRRAMCNEMYHNTSSNSNQNVDNDG